MRHHVLVTYDIAHPRRLRRVFRIAKGYGEGFQDSVFLCQLSEKDEAVFREKIRDEIHHREDQVVFLRLGPVKDKVNELGSEWTVLGKPLEVRDLRNLIF